MLMDMNKLRTSLGGKVSAAGDPDWDIARQAFNLSLDQRPELVAWPADPDDVARVVGFASQGGCGSPHSSPAMAPHRSVILEERFSSRLRP
jgi:hypothetical protein